MSRPQTNHRIFFKTGQFKSAQTLQKNGSQPKLRQQSDLPSVHQLLKQSLAQQQLTSKTPTQIGTGSGTHSTTNLPQSIKQKRSRQLSHYNMDDINLKLDLKTITNDNQQQQSTHHIRNVTTNTMDFGKLSAKIKFNESRSIMKSNLMAVESLLNFKVGENTINGFSIPTDTVEIKKILIQLISDTKSQHEILQQRCARIKEILDIYEQKIQYDDVIYLKDRDVARMNEHINQLTETLMSATKTEFQLNEKLRELAKLKHDYSQLKYKNEHQEKQILVISQEVRDLRTTINRLKENETANHIQKTSDQNAIQALYRKIEFLEKGIEAFNSQSLGQVNNSENDSKLRGTINFLIRENQEQKKDIALKLKLNHTKEKEIYKLMSRIQKLTQKRQTNVIMDINSDDINLPDKLKFNKQTDTSMSFLSLTENSQSQEEDPIPCLLKFDESHKNLEYRYLGLYDHEKDIIKDLVEHGAQFFIEYSLTKNEVIQMKEKFTVVTEQLVKALKFIEQYNAISHFIVVESKNQDEKRIIEAVQRLAQQVYKNRVQRVQLWVKDFHNNELWTIHNNALIALDANQDIVGQCNMTMQNIVVDDLSKCAFLSKKYDKAFQKADLFSFKEREYVIALPVKHPRSSLILGILEICCLTDSPLQNDDLYISDVLSHMFSIMLSRFHENRIQIKQIMASKKVIISANKIFQNKDNLQQLTVVVENLLCQLFNIQKARFLIYNNGYFEWHSSSKDSLQSNYEISNQPKRAAQSFGLPVIQQKFAQIIQNPSSQANYNIAVDLDTNLPTLCYPIFSKKITHEKTIIALVQIPQIQYKINQDPPENYVFKNNLTSIKEIAIDEGSREALEYLSIVLQDTLSN